MSSEAVREGGYPLLEGIKIIKRWEGCRLDLYLCPAGLPTIGYGHVVSARERAALAGGITQDMAEDLLVDDVERFMTIMSRLITVELTPRQAGAILSWTFNLGGGNLRSSTLLKRINEGDHGDVPYQIRRWNKCRGRVLPGLTARREDEAQLYIAGT